MSKNWGTFWNKSKKPLKTCWLITAGFVSLYVGLIQPRGYQREIAQTRATGLGAVAGGPSWQPISLWRQMSVDKAVIGGALGEAAGSKAAVMTYLEGDVGRGDADKTVDRELVRTASLSLVVKAPSEASERIIQLAQAADGFLVSSQLGGAADVPSASLTIRVPASKFDEVRAQIRKLSLHVESESIEAQDVTKQYVDQEARLRNLRAEEVQYLGILRKATTVKDTLEVSDKLREVRGAIEEKQAEFEVLSKQVETVAINVTLRAEADAQVFGLHWRPLYQLKIAAREGLDGLGNYVSSITSLLFYLPTILLWLLTILAGAAIGWRIIRWAARVFFHYRGPTAEVHN